MVSCDDESTRGILGVGQKVVNAEDRSHLGSEATGDNVGATIAADNRAFQIGRPTRVGPGPGYEQIGNGAPRYRSEEFRTGPKWQDGMLDLVLSQSIKMTAGLQEM